MGVSFLFNRSLGEIPYRFGGDSFSTLSNLKITGRRPSVQQEISGVGWPAWMLCIIGRKSDHAQAQKPSGGSHRLSEVKTCPSSNRPQGLPML
jgi:hypothetical protein